VNAVTADDVQAAAKKHIHPDKLVQVAAGALDQKGEPLKRKKEK
jgi:predicted Zn-dependent peptidase